MDRKFFRILVMLLFTLSPFFVAHADDKKYGEFPHGGGTTSDGIEVTQPSLHHMAKIKDMNQYVTAFYKDCHLSFKVKVPAGKDADLYFTRNFQVDTSKKHGGQSRTNFVVECDGNPIYTNQYYEGYGTRKVDVIIPEGEHTVKLVAKTNEKSYLSGVVGDLSLHIHEFGDTTYVSEPICGVPGKKTIECGICHQLKSIEIPHSYPKHSFKKIDLSQTSCMGISNVIFFCEHCPYFEKNNQRWKEPHDFDASGTCKVCHLSMPKCNADSTVFEVYNASEMRLLSEQVSIGKISGNIGIDIKGDLVFGDNLLMLPLGTTDNPFRGVINGNGHHVRGIVNTFQGTDCMGFVGVAEGTILSHAVISNLIIDQDNVLQGLASIGGIVGMANYCDIVNCASFGTFNGTDHVGGIVGFAGKHVGIINCASAVSISARGKWNALGCGLSHGRIMNSYAAGTNIKKGIYDQLPTTTLRHCFSTLASSTGLRQVSQDFLSSYDMVELLNQESDTHNFTMEQGNPYPIPVANADIQAKSNRAFPVQHADISRRAAPFAAGDDDESADKETETFVFNGYVVDNADAKLGWTIDEVIEREAVEYADFNRLYLATRTVPDGAKLYEPVSGGELCDLESYIIPNDSSFIKLREYRAVSADRLIPTAEIVDDLAAANEQIDEYAIRNDVYTHLSRITFENENDFVYEENINGILRPMWSMVTENDDDGKPVATNVYSFNYVTGEIRLEYSYEHSDYGEEEDENYEEYLDTQTNTIHAVYSYVDPATGKVTARDHYILRPSDRYPIEMRSEDLTGDTPVLTEGMYFIYDDEGYILQTVSFFQDGDELLPYSYCEYIGAWRPTLLPTAIEIPVAQLPNLQKRMDPHVYDMRGRVVRRVTDQHDPFSGLPRGIYVYQGKKFIK